MTKSEIEFLRERWDAKLSEAGMRFLLGKGTSVFPDLDSGRKDLRGIAIKEFLKYISIHDVDFSGSLIVGFGQFGMCSVERCVFRDSILDTNVGLSFQACDFGGAIFLGGVLRGKFTDCDFTLANLTSVGGTEVKFIRCAFVKTNFRKAHLIHCSFEDCRFENCKFGTGSLGGSKFVRSPIDPETLGNTLMENVKWM